MAQPDPYRTLLVHPDADDEIIQVVYRKLAQRYHPDVAAAPDAARLMSELNAARDLLLDPVRRAEYDKAAADRSARRARTAAARQPDTEPAGASSAPRDSSPRDSAPRASAPPTHHAPRPEPRPAAASGPAATASGSAAAAGPPPGNPSGSVLNFGRYAGWSLGEIARVDLEYIEWLERTPIGRPYRPELDGILRVAGRRRADPGGSGTRTGFGRR